MALRVKKTSLFNDRSSLVWTQNLAKLIDDIEKKTVDCHLCLVHYMFSRFFCQLLCFDFNSWEEYDLSLEK